jgi:hypothetical protein
MPRPLTALGFRGMNNLEQAPGILLDDAKRITPKIALNVEVLDGGKLVRRQGYSLQIPLPGAHSLWAGSIMLVVSEGTLYRVESSTVTPITTVGGPKFPVCYAELDNLIYMATPAWSSIYDLLGGQVRSWGISIPPAPDFSLIEGDMPPGTYSFCYTQTVGDRISGNGQIVKVSWEGGTKGIQLNNLPSSGQCWVTHPNGTDLFMAELDSGVIFAPTVIPLPSFQVAPPSGMSFFAQAFGRMWACAGKNLIFSDPFQYEWFRTPNFKPFIEDLIMVAPVTDGLFVSSKDNTWFLDGTEPAKMVLKHIGDGAIPGTLVYAELPGAIVGGGYEMSRRLSQIPAPVWIGKHGVVIGTQTGHLVHLTESRLRMSIRSQGGSLFRVKNGVPQIISVLSGPLLDEEFETLEHIFEDGKLFD